MSHRGCLKLAALLAALAGLAPAGRAQETKAKPEGAPTAQPGPKVRALEVDPASAPRPALKYRLLPLEADRTPGNAAPVYLRIRHEMIDLVPTTINEKHTAWIEKLTGPFPVAEARAFVDQFSSRTQQLDFGARRQRCDWGYTLAEQKENAYEILLPDAQGMRIWSRLLVVKARTEIAEHKFDDAIRTIETGLALARHVAEGPFLINNLVGIAIANQMLDCVEKLIDEPGSPNLYWALTALPRPPIDIRNAMETEQRLGEYMIPEIADLERPRTDAEWSALLIRLVDRLNAVRKILPMLGALKHRDVKEVGLDQFRAELLPEARAYVKGREPGAGPISDDRALVLYVAGRYREIRDDAFKSVYLPFPAGVALRAEKGLDADKPGPQGLFIEMAPNIEAGQLAEARLELWVATLRAVEALRMYAAQHGGAFPATLAELPVPISVNTVTGKPFEYTREPGGVVLVAPVPQIPPNGYHYRISIRH